MGVGESGLPSAAASVHEPSTEEKEPEVNEKRNSKASNSGDDDDDFEYPTKWKLAIITLALCLSVFCMALVSFIVRLDIALTTRLTSTGQHDHCNSYSSHHRSVQGT